MTLTERVTAIWNKLTGMEAKVEKIDGMEAKLTGIEAQLSKKSESDEDEKEEEQDEKEPKEKKGKGKGKSESEEDDEKDKDEEASLPEQITALKIENAALKARAEKADTDFKAYKDGETARVNMVAATMIAASGFTAPVATVQTKKEKEPGKPDLSALTGFAKVSAAFAAAEKK
jgi:hypothetical protein